MQQNHQLTINHPQETRSITYEYAGGPFKLTTKGIFFIGNDQEGNPLPATLDLFTLTCGR